MLGILTAWHLNLSLGMVLPKYVIIVTSHSDVERAHDGTTAHCSLMLQGLIHLVGLGNVGMVLAVEQNCWLRSPCC
jgi:hypothetical protein